MSNFRPAVLKMMATSPAYKEYYRSKDTGVIPPEASCNKCSNYNQAKGICTPKKKKVKLYNRCQDYNKTFIPFEKQLANVKESKK